MSYNLIIGEAIIESYAEAGLEAVCYITAESERHANAPAFEEFTDYTNERWSSYTAWYNFCESVGLTHVMYNSSGNMRGNHPGAFPINKEFKQEIDAAMERLVSKYPKARATYDTGTDEDGAMCHLTWLQYWTNWALENCESPVFVNS